jgi:hypothetical protein
MVKLLIEQGKDSGRYEELDMNYDSSLVMNYKAKDASDISKTFATFAQSFLIPASPKNVNLLQFIFDPIVYIFRDEFVNAKIYINSELFKLGQINITSGNFGKDGKLSSFNADFFTSFTNFKDIVGDDTLNKIAGTNSYIKNGVLVNVPESSVQMAWTDDSVNGYLRLGVTSYDKIIVPLISSERVLNINATSSNPADIHINDTGGYALYPYSVRKEELRPAIPISYIMDRIQQYYGLSFSSNTTENDSVGIFDDPNYKYLYTMCNYDDAIFQGKSFYIGATDSFVYGGGGFTVSQPYTTSLGSDGLSFTITGGESVSTVAPGYTSKVSKVEFSVSFYSINVGEAKFILQKTNSDGSIKVIDTQTGKWTSTPSPGNAGKLAVKFNIPLLSLGETYSFILKLEAEDTISIFNGSSDPLVNGINYSTIISYETRFITHPGNPGQWVVSKYYNINNNNFKTSKDSNIKLISHLPNMKVVDFLNSIVKTFNLRIQEGIDNRSLYFYQPSDFNTIKLPINNGEVNYTPYAVTTLKPAKKVDKYKTYKYTYATSKYYSNVEYAKLMVNNPNSKEFGQLLSTDSNYNTNDIYSVENKFSLNIPRVIANSRITSFYGFDSGEPTIKSFMTQSGSTQSAQLPVFKPNTTDLSLYWYSGLVPTTNDIVNDSGIYDTINLAYHWTDGNFVSAFNRYNRLSIDNSTYISAGVYSTPSFSLGYKDEIDVMTNTSYENTLYSEYYSEYIKRILDPRTYLYTINLSLPYVKLKEFDVKNKVVIGNMRYSIEEAQLDLDTGKCKLLLMNDNFSTITVKDTIPPTAPTSLSAVQSSNNVLLSWSGATDNTLIMGYEIQYKPSYGNTWIITVPFVKTPNGYGSVNVPLLTIGQQYDFRVRTVDVSNNVSDYIQISFTLVSYSSMWSINSYSSPNLYFTRNYGTDTAVTVQTSTNGTTWGSSTGGVASPRNIGALATGTLIRLISISDSTISNVITV